MRAATFTAIAALQMVLLRKASIALRGEVIVALLNGNDLFHRSKIRDVLMHCLIIA